MYARGDEFPNEGFVQKAIEMHFKNKGYELEIDKFADLVCIHPTAKKKWIIEAKGQSQSIGIDFRTGLGQILQKMKEEDAFYAVAVPYSASFIRQCDNVPKWVRNRYDFIGSLSQKTELLGKLRLKSAANNVQPGPWTPTGAEKSPSAGQGRGTLFHAEASTTEEPDAGETACPELCGGCRVTGIPTADILSIGSAYMPLDINHNPMFSDGTFPIEHKSATVDGIKMFYREAGPREGPVILLLHGFPSSSRMFKTFFPLLSSTYHLIAPDFPGFGHSDAPPPKEFSYTFDNLAQCVDKLLSHLNISRYTLYLQDYGGPVGFRLALANPERVVALIIQNAVAHVEGLSESWAIRKSFWLDRGAYEDTIREALLSPEVARQRHLAGVARPEVIDPDTWVDEFAFLTRPGMAEIQIELVYDYQTNVAAYPRWQAYLRECRPPTLVVWGKNDPLFTVAGALAFGKDLPDAEIHLLNASHFALDEEAGLIAALVHQFLRERWRGIPDKLKSEEK